MDNEAFRALVEERAKPKSTKEIAREAVEEEFRTRKTKRKRGGGGGGSSSEDNGSDNNDDSDREDAPSKKELLVPSAAKKKARAEHESKYRDRAKERREGKNVDYQDQASLMEGVAAAADEGQMDQVTLTKYLGGDEAHTHLVKGLDVALARRVKQEMDMETTETETTAVLPSTTRQAQKSTVVVRDATEARSLLQNIKPETITSELGRQMLSHMKQVYLQPRDVSRVVVRTSPAGLAIQRSTLTFCTLGNTHDRNRAWELPLESLQASASNKELDASSNTATVQGATSLDSTLLYQIKGAFERHATNTQDRASGGIKQEFTCSTEKEGDEDDNEDIFNDAADAYTPPTLTDSKRPFPRDNLREDNQSKANGESIFAGLTAPKLHQPTPVAASSPFVTQKHPAAKQQVISRNVWGSTSNGTKTKRAKIGVSIASYEGGYGEEMDVDFDGRFADEEDEGGVGMKRGKEKGKQQEKQGRSNE